MKNIILEGSKNHNIFHYQPLNYVQQILPNLEGKKYKDFFIIKNNKRFDGLISKPDSIKETTNIISNGLLSIWSDISGIDISSFQNVLQNINDELITPMFDENMNMNSIILNSSPSIKNEFGKEEKLRSGEKMSDYLLYKFFTQLKGLEKLAIKDEVDFVKHSLHYNYALHLMLIDIHDKHKKDFKWFLECLNEIVLLSPDVMDKIRWVEDGTINYKDIVSLKGMKMDEIVNSLIRLKMVDESLSETLETAIATNYNTIRMNLITTVWYLITNRTEYLLFTDTMPNSNEYLLELKTGIMILQTTEIEHMITMHEKVLSSPDYFSELYPVQYCHKHSVYLLTPFKELTRKIPNSIIMLLLAFYQFVKGDLKEDKEHEFPLDKYTIKFTLKIKDLSIINQIEDVFYSKFEKISLNTKVEDRDNKYALSLVKNFEDLEKYQEKIFHILNNNDDIPKNPFEEMNEMFRNDKNKILRDFEKLEHQLIEDKKIDVIDKREEKELREEIKEEKKEKAEETKKLVLFNEQLKYRNELLENIKELFHNHAVYEDVSMLYETIRIELNNVLKLTSLESVKRKFEDIFQMSMKYVKIKKADALNKVKFDFVYYTDLYAGIFASEQMIYNGYIKREKKLLEDLSTKNVMIDEKNILKDIKEKYDTEVNVEIKGLMNELYMAEKIVETMKQTIVDDQKIFEKEEHYRVTHEKFHLMNLVSDFRIHVLSILNKDLEASTELNELLDKVTFKHHKNSTLLRIKGILVQGTIDKDERLVKFKSTDDKDIYFKQLDDFISAFEKSDKNIMNEMAIIKDKVNSLSKQLITELESKEVTSPNRVRVINEIRDISLSKPVIIENLKQSLAEIFKSIKSEVLKEKVLKDFDNLVFYYLAAIEQGIIITNPDYPHIEAKKISSCLKALNGEDGKNDKHDEIYGLSKRGNYVNRRFGKYSEHKLTCAVAGGTKRTRVITEEDDSELIKIKQEKLKEGQRKKIKVEKNKKEDEDTIDEEMEVKVEQKNIKEQKIKDDKKKKEEELKKKNDLKKKEEEIIKKKQKEEQIFLKKKKEQIFLKNEEKIPKKEEKKENIIEVLKVKNQEDAKAIIDELNNFSVIFIVVDGNVEDIFDNNTDIILIKEKQIVTENQLEDIFASFLVLEYNDNFVGMDKKEKQEFYSRAMNKYKIKSESKILETMDGIRKFMAGIQYEEYLPTYKKFKENLLKSPLFEFRQKTSNSKLTGRGFGGGGHGGFGGGHGFGGGFGGHGGFGGRPYGGIRGGGFLRPGYGGYGYGYGYPYWLYPGFVAGTLTAAELATWNAYMNSQNYQNPNLYANQGVVYSSNKIVSAPLSSKFHKKTEEELKWKKDALDNIKKSMLLMEFISSCKLTNNGVFDVVKILKGYLILMLVSNELRIKTNLALYGWSIDEIKSAIGYKRTYLSCYRYNKKTKERVKTTPLLHYRTSDVASLMDLYKSIPALNKILTSKQTISGIINQPLANSNDVLLTIIKNVFIQNSKWEEIFKENSWSIGDKVREYRESSFHKNTDLLNFATTSKLIKNVY